MLESCQNAQERWGGVNLLIDRWLQQRHALVEAFVALERATVLNSAALQGFCQLLVDYVSAGHFEVYGHLAEEAQSFDDQRGLELARRIYPRLDAITQVALGFNDRCDNGDNRDVLSVELKQLGQLLHERFELEDCLIEVLHKRHGQQAQALSS